MTYDLNDIADMVARFAVTHPQYEVYFKITLRKQEVVLVKRDISGKFIKKVVQETVEEVQEDGKS